MPNKSMDFFIFDETQSVLLDWPKRFQIINGIARGLLYLHQDSRMRIVHRDLKASNVLLDSTMNPKISDFGTARILDENDYEAKTTRVVGTYGYMPPEYAIDGHFSRKSDVFSFGVIVLEIISGKRNRGFNHQEHCYNLLGHAWRLFLEGKSLEIVNPVTGQSYNASQALKSIHIALLCVQHCPEDRPSMSSVIVMLQSDCELAQPKMPGFFVERNMVEEYSSKSFCNNEITVTTIASGR
ncbi:G-type lectin S-receptor-like serine/threonine-protein kinase SD1-1 [Ancistrocladus abbreviatus]